MQRRSLRNAVEIRLAGLLAAAWYCAAAHALVPHTVGYQGLLTSAGGTPINATVPMTFRLYAAASGGTPLYTETQSVVVTDGAFNALIGSVTALTLPFDVQYYLGIAVGADPEMTPRQPLAAAAYAIRAASTEALAGTATVAGSQITGSLSSATLPGSSVTGTIGTPQIANNAVTQSKLSPLSGAASGKVLGTDGSNLQWQTVGAGTVTSVTATGGGGLATTPPGGISAAGSVGIASSGVQTAMIADGAVTPAKLASAQQLPSCIIGQIARWNGATWACGNLPPVISAVDRGNVGGATSLAIPPDGNPVVGYIRNGSAWPSVAKCSAPACDGVASIEAVPAPGSQKISVAIAPDGLPVVAVYIFDGFQGDLVLVKCSHPGCVGDGGTYHAVDVSDRGDFVSLATGSDGFPVMAYYQNTVMQRYMIVAHCPNAPCFPGGPFGIPVDATNANLGRYTSLAIGSDGFPIVSYRDDQNTSLRVAKCGNVDCTSGATLTTVDNAADVGEFTSIKIGTDGRPVISYYDRSNGDLKVAKCANAACTGTATISTVDSGGDVGSHTSLALGADGFPVIAYRDETNKALKVAKCINAACTGISRVSRMDASGDVGMYPSIAVASDGMPIISYLDATISALKIAKCTNIACLAP